MSSKTIGIVGGIGPESTIEYYRSIIATYREYEPNGSPSIFITSIDANKMLRLIEESELPMLADYLLAELHKLAKGGAVLGLLAANTPHVVFDELSRTSPIPLVSIVEATCRTARALGLRKVALFGTRFTMEGQFYPAVFSKSGVVLVAPNRDRSCRIAQTEGGVSQ